jgi:hypothetical protein
LPHELSAYSVAVPGLPLIAPAEEGIDSAMSDCWFMLRHRGVGGAAPGVEVNQ